MSQTTLLPFHHAALRAIRSIPGYRTMRFLEMGCGDGMLLEKLRDDGVQEARGTTFWDEDADYIRRRPYPAGLTVDLGIDLNKPLPYPDAQFDVVYSTEVIEHVEGHRNFILEAARVLQPGGHLVLTTPNIHRILSRFNYALSGFHFTKQALIPRTYPASRMEEFHHRCPDFPHLHWLLWKGGLRIESIDSTDTHLVSHLAYALSPLMRARTRHQAMRHCRGDAEDRAARADLVRWLNSRAMLCSEHLCLKARKQPRSAP